MVRIYYNSRPSKLNRCRENRTEAAAPQGHAEKRVEIVGGRTVVVGLSASPPEHHWVEEKQQKLGRGKSIIRQVGFSERERPTVHSLPHLVLGWGGRVARG